MNNYAINCFRCYIVCKVINNIVIMIKKICIAGRNGYTGQLLEKFINKHPNFEMVGSLALTKDKLDQKKHQYFLYDLESTVDIDFLVLATPADISIEIVKVIKQKKLDLNIIDLSGAFRLNNDALTSWYKLSHNIDGLEDGAKYGLSPNVKFNSEDKVIANPGCYATCILLAFKTLVKT